MNDLSLKEYFTLFEDDADGNALIVLKQIIKDGKITNKYQVFVLRRMLEIKEKQLGVGNMFQNLSNTSMVDIANMDAADVIKLVDEVIAWLESHHDGAPIMSLAALKQASNADD